MPILYIIKVEYEYDHEDEYWFLRTAKYHEEDGYRQRGMFTAFFYGENEVYNNWTNKRKFTPVKANKIVNQLPDDIVISQDFDNIYEFFDHINYDTKNYRTSEIKKLIGKLNDYDIYR